MLSWRTVELGRLQFRQLEKNSGDLKKFGRDDGTKGVLMNIGSGENKFKRAEEREGGGSSVA